MKNAILNKYFHCGTFFLGAKVNVFILILFLVLLHAAELTVHMVRASGEVDDLTCPSKVLTRTDTHIPSFPCCCNGKR